MKMGMRLCLVLVMCGEKGVRKGVDCVISLPSSQVEKVDENHIALVHLYFHPKFICAWQCGVTVFLFIDSMHKDS